MQLLNFSKHDQAQRQLADGDLSVLFLTRVYYFHNRSRELNNGICSPRNNSSRITDDNRVSLTFVLLIVVPINSIH